MAEPEAITVVSYRAALKRAFRESWHLLPVPETVGKAIVASGIALAPVGLAAWRFGLDTPVIPGWLAAAGPTLGWIGVAFIALFIVNLFRAPVLIAREQQEANRQLGDRIQALIASKPSITVTPVSENGQHGLLVSNAGGRAIFQARLRIVDCSVSGNRSTGNRVAWNNGSTEADIFNAGEEALVIGSAEEWPGFIRWRLLGVLGTEVKPVIDYNYVPQQGGNAPPVAIIELTITADPAFASGPWRGRFQFTHLGIVGLPREGQA
jgi:hypothetical protein